jgi:glycoside/pentoside/hexuronide:cation symporter, GPH family
MNQTVPPPAAPPVPPSDPELPRKTAERDKLPVHEKALYGLGNQSMGMVNQVIEYQVQQVLVYGLGMSPVWKGVMIMIFRIWDAFSDPFMGWLSDNTRSRYGRRRPYMFFGTLAMAALLPFVWRFDESWDMIYIAVWFTLAGMIMSTATTVFNIPYQTLKMEMTPDYNERTSINMYIMVVGSLFGILISPWVWKMTQNPFFTGQAIGEAPNTLLGIRNLSIWFAGLAILFGLIPTFFCKERYYANASKQKKEPLVKSLKMTFASKPFRLMLGLILAGSLEGLVVGMGGYISLYYVFGADKIFAATFHGITGTIGGFVGLAGAPLFGWLAIKWGKERALLLVTAIHVLMALSIIFFYNPDYPWLAAVPMILNGAMVGAFWVIIPAMKADIVDDDELINGERREGSFESVFSWLLRFTGTVFAGLSGFVVVFLGFNIEMGAEQAEGVFRKMIWAMALVPTALGILQFWIIMKWPLTARRMAEIRAELEARRGAIDMQKGA